VFGHRSAVHHREAIADADPVIVAADQLARDKRQRLTPLGWVDV